MNQTKQELNAVELDARDLPAFCPHTSMPLWSSHPRVYLDLTHAAEAKCPYCGTLYRLKAGVSSKAH